MAELKAVEKRLESVTAINMLTVSGVLPNGHVPFIGEINFAVTFGKVVIKHFQ